MNKKKLFGKVQVILLISLMVVSLVAVSSFAADKLIVKDAAGTTDVFKVDDTGQIEARSAMFIKLSGISTISSVFDTPTAYRLAVFDTYTGMQGIGTGSHAWDKFYFFGDRARGTVDAPTAALDGDGVFEVLGRVYDGTAMRATAGIGFLVDGPVSLNNAPQRMVFYTGAGDTRLPRITIQSGGNIQLNDLESTYTGGSAYVCVNDSGIIYASEIACP